MKKENDIPFFEILDFEVFVLPEQKSDLLIKNNDPNAAILVVYFNDKNDPELEVLLKSIFSAVKLDIDREIVSLKTTLQKRYSFKEIMEKLSIKDFIFFGIHPSNFGLNYSIESYQPLTVKNLRILLLDSLEEVNTAIDKKKALWSCLKEMYLQNKPN